MRVVGKELSVSKNGDAVTKLHVIDDFEPYCNDSERGRSCIGKKVSVIYAGKYECSAIPVGADINVFYGPIIKTPTKTFSLISKIELVKKTDEDISSKMRRE